MKATYLMAMSGLLLAADFASAQPISSEYTTIDRERDCALIARSDGEGDWADFVCPGYRGFPVFIRYTDGREIATYGYGLEQGMPNIMPFNEAGDTVEWRIRTDGETAAPFAAIQRWHISHPEGFEDMIGEILVVSRVGQPMEGGACAVAFLPATGNPSANEQAREIADGQAADFKCGSDEVSVDPALEGMVAPAR